MQNLNEIRAEINGIDAEIVPLLERRMYCAGQVAAAKRQTAEQTGEQPVVFVAAREQEILANVDVGEHTQSVRQLMGEIMGVSRCRQYRLMIEGGALSDPMGEYLSGERVILPICGSLREAMRIVCRYAVEIYQADLNRIEVSAADAAELAALRAQLFAEGYLDI